MRLYIWFQTMHNVDWLFVRMHKLIRSLKLYPSERPKKLKLFPSDEIDGSHLSWEPNIQITNYAMQYLRIRDIVLCT